MFRGISQKIQRKSSELVKVGRKAVAWQFEIVYHPTEVGVYFINNSRGTVVLMVGLTSRDIPVWFLETRCPVSFPKLGQGRSLFRDVNAVRFWGDTVRLVSPGNSFDLTGAEQFFNPSTPIHTFQKPPEVLPPHSSTKKPQIWEDHARTCKWLIIMISKSLTGVVPLPNGLNISIN